MADVRGGQLGPETRTAAEKVKEAVEAEFRGVRVEIDTAVGDPDTEHAYLWLDGAGAEAEEYVDAWEYAHRLAERLWQERDLFFVVKKRNAPAGEGEEGRGGELD